MAGSTCTDGRRRGNVRADARERSEAGSARHGRRVGSPNPSDGGFAGGALFGWLIDRWLGTAPWFLLGLMFLGVAVGFRNIIKISGERPE